MLRDATFGNFFEECVLAYFDGVKDDRLRVCVREIYQGVNMSSGALRTVYEVIGIRAT